MTKISKLSATELVNLYGSAKLSPLEAVKAALGQAHLANSTLNAFVAIDDAGAMLAAEASEMRWRSGTQVSSIDGVPITIKDIVQCRGLDVRYGSLATPDISARDDAPSVARLRKAGAVIIGLTATPEFGWKAVTDSRKYGITRNPWNADMTPGGSSGGAAVAAAIGAGALHLGTDGGGSIRIPASFTGIVGHKPSFGRVAAYPPSAFGTVAHIGPMARTVEDIAAMLQVMSGRDVQDWTQPAHAFADVAIENFSWQGKRVGYWATPCIGSTDSAVSSAIEATLKDIELAGANIEPITLPMSEELYETFLRHWFVGAANRLTAVDEQFHNSLDVGFLKAAEKGAQYSAIDRIKAEVTRAQFGAEMDALLQKYDLVISPTVPHQPFAAGHDVPPGSGLQNWIEWSSFSFPINLSQQPACSVPCGFTQNGLPIGLQMIGPRGDDVRVLSAALTYQHMFPDRFLLSNGHWPSSHGEVA
jgi:aspartyl-tRNA(Asn)/glutamyl-tRNA(Gln) amidotransferase subunit A